MNQQSIHIVTIKSNDRDDYTYALNTQPQRVSDLRCPVGLPKTFVAKIFSWKRIGDVWLSSPLGGWQLFSSYTLAHHG